MRKYVFPVCIVLPLLLGCSYAAQSWTVDPQPAPFGISSEESGTGAYLGVDVSDVTTERLEALKLKEEKGVEVTMVDQDAPAGKAGVKEHDVILTMNGEPIESGAQLRRMIHETPAGRLVSLGVSRDGQPLTLKVQLGDRRKEFSYVAPKAKEFHFEIPPIPNMPDFEMPGINVVVVNSSARSGLMVENITQQLGEFFGAKNGNGVLIRSVEKGSRAEKAGFRAGDLVVKVNGQPVRDTGDFSRALRSGSGAISISVMRDKKEQNLNLTLPERKDSGEVIEESSDAPEIDASAEVELSRLRDEVAELSPQMELAVQSMRKAKEYARKSACDQQKQLRRQVDPFREEMRPEIQEQIEMEMEKMQHEMSGEWLDI